MSDIDDAELGQILVKSCLLTAEELRECESTRKESGRPLSQVIVEKGLLNIRQIDATMAGIRKRARFCARCDRRIHFPHTTLKGEFCPHCQGPLQRPPEPPPPPPDERLAAPEQREIDSMVRLTRDILPPEVRTAMASPDRVFGKYVLLEVLGRGGMGFVQKAWDVMMGRFVALKFINEIPPDPDATREAAMEVEERNRSLVQEARTAARLRHAHIVPVHDVGRIKDRLYVSMDYIDGESLARRVESAGQRGWPSPLYEDPAYYVGLLRDIAHALHFAHSFSTPVVHCDLKPSNILVSSGNVACVVDFGLARMLDAAKDEDIGVCGTPAYMAPEQVRGRTGGIGAWTDIYGLGGLIYFLLVGQAPYLGPPMQILSLKLNKEPEPPTEALRLHPSFKKLISSSAGRTVLPRLEQIAQRCMARRPEDRYPSAQRVADEIENLLDAVQRRRARPWMTRGGELKPGWQETMLEDFRASLLKRLNTHRVMPADGRALDLGEGPVEAVKATPSRLYVLRKGIVHVVDWTAPPPGRILALAESAGMRRIDDRLAMGLLALRAGDADRAAIHLAPVKGTSLEGVAAHIRDAAVSGASGRSRLA